MPESCFEYGFCAGPDTLITFPYSDDGRVDVASHNQGLVLVGVQLRCLTDNARDIRVAGKQYFEVEIVAEIVKAPADGALVVGDGTEKGFFYL